ncbi:MAG: hypothetical protein JXA49_04380 [Actinobacteria bacterium]|nr:hypothetical protein [Actinomycetota bacterium]
MENQKHGDIPPGILSMAAGGVDEDLILGIARSNPDFVLAVLKSMNPTEIINVINTNREFFVKIAREMPPEMLGRLIRQQPDLVASMVENMGPEFLLEIMGNNQ